MLTFQSHEIKIIKGWAEQAAGSPFPQEINLLNRLNRAGFAPSITLTRAEVEIVQHWAEKDTSGHHGSQKFLLEPEYQLLERIEQYLEIT